MGISTIEDFFLFFPLWLPIFIVLFVLFDYIKSFCLDSFVGLFVAFSPFKFAEDGWGGPCNFGQLNPHDINIIWVDEWYVNSQNDTMERQGYFKSPLASQLNSNGQKVKVHIVRPNTQMPLEGYPVTVLFAELNDQGMINRMKIGRQLAKQNGIASLILELPLTGTRRPKAQYYGMVRTVHDLMLRQHAAIVEGASVCKWLREQHNVRSICVGGVSFGAGIAASISCILQFPVITILMLPHFQGGDVLDGILSPIISWRSLINADYKDVCAIKAKLQKLFNTLSPASLPQPSFSKGVTLLAAAHDRCFPSSSVKKLASHWDVNEIQYLECGHVYASLFQKNAYNDAIVDGIKKFPKFE